MLFFNIFHTDDLTFKEVRVNLFAEDTSMNIICIRERIPNDIFTALELNSILTDYANKPQKIAAMLRNSEIIQIRRGLYTFPAPLRHAILSNGLLANQIYGPSYVSEDYALSYYGLIPEAPMVTTSIAMGRSRTFSTPLGTFSYRYSRSQAYSIGITIAGEETKRFFIATPEKALFDKILFDKRYEGGDPEEYLCNDLRIEPTALKRMRRDAWLELKPFMTGHLKATADYLLAI